METQKRNLYNIEYKYGHFIKVYAESTDQAYEIAKELVGKSNYDPSPSYACFPVQIEGMSIWTQKQWREEAQKK